MKKKGGSGGDTEISIYGARADDRLGGKSPEFFDVGADGHADMVVRGGEVDKDDDPEGVDAGAVYIFWDFFEKHGGAAETIDLATHTADLLTIYGASAGDRLGDLSPKFLNLDGDENTDMFVASKSVDKTVNGEDVENCGAIYILSDVLNRAGVIDLADYKKNDLLTVYGGEENDELGDQDPQFFDIDDDGAGDMIVNVPAADKSVDLGGGDDAGAVYIFWDLGSLTETIDLAKNTSDVLVVFGAREGDELGTYSCEFFDFDGDGKTDILIRNDGTRDTLDPANAGANTKASYILWGSAIHGGYGVINLGELRDGAIAAFTEDGDGKFSNAGVWLKGSDSFLSKELKKSYVFKDADGDRLYELVAKNADPDGQFGYWNLDGLEIDITNLGTADGFVDDDGATAAGSQSFDAYSGFGADIVEVA